MLLRVDHRLEAVPRFHGDGIERRQGTLDQVHEVPIVVDDEHPFHDLLAGPWRSRGAGIASTSGAQAHAVFWASATHSKGARGSTHPIAADRDNHVRMVLRVDFNPSCGSRTYMMGSGSRKKL